MNGRRPTSGIPAFGRLVRTAGLEPARGCPKGSYEPGDSSSLPHLFFCLFPPLLFGGAVSLACAHPLFAQAQNIRHDGLYLKISQARIFHTFWIVQTFMCCLQKVLQRYGTDVLALSY